MNSFIGPLPSNTQPTAATDKRASNHNQQQTQPISRSSPLNFLSLRRGSPIVPLSPGNTSTLVKYKQGIRKHEGGREAKSLSPQRPSFGNISCERGLFSTELAQLNHSSNGAFERFVKKTPSCPRFFQAHPSKQSSEFTAPKCTNNKKTVENQTEHEIKDVGALQPMEVEAEVLSIVCHRRRTESGESIESSLTDHHIEEDEPPGDDNRPDVNPEAPMINDYPSVREGTLGSFPSLWDENEGQRRVNIMARRHTVPSPFAYWSDLEVQETNRIEAKLRRRSEARSGSDGQCSYSSSTESTNIPVCTSPATIREGATLAVDRWYNSAICDSGVGTPSPEDLRPAQKILVLSPPTHSPEQTQAGATVAPKRPSFRRVVPATKEPFKPMSLLQQPNAPSFAQIKKVGERKFVTDAKTGG